MALVKLGHAFCTCSVVHDHYPSSVVQGRQGMVLRQSRRQQGSLGGRASQGLADMAVDDVPGSAMHREPSAGSSMSDDAPPGDPPSHSHCS